MLERFAVAGLEIAALIETGLVLAMLERFAVAGLEIAALVETGLILAMLERFAVAGVEFVAMLGMGAGIARAGGFAVAARCGRPSGMRLRGSLFKIRLVAAMLILHFISLRAGARLLAGVKSGARAARKVQLEWSDYSCSPRRVPGAIFLPVRYALAVMRFAPGA